MTDQDNQAPVAEPVLASFPRRIGLIANPLGFVEIRAEYPGALIGVALPPAEARELAQYLVSFADQVDALVAAAVAVAQPSKPTEAVAEPAADEATADAVPADAPAEPTQEVAAA